MPDPTHGMAGVAQERKQYARLVALSPNALVKRLLREAAPVLLPKRDGTRATTVTKTQRLAVHRLDPVLSARCGDTSSNVFKVGVS